MNSHDVILSIIAIAEEVSNKNKNRDEIVGRTSIQKITYFTQQVCKELKLPEFKPHFYGPYSAEIGMSLADLVSSAFVDEERILGRRYDAYKYRLTDGGKFITNIVKEKNEVFYENIKSLVTKCNDMCLLKSKPLSYAAKLKYILNESEKKISTEELKKRGEELGWELSTEDTKRALDLLKELGMT